MSHYHFLGIAGTAMAGAALLMKEMGHTVSGSDEAIYPPMSTLLESQKIDIASPFAATNLPKWAYTAVIGNALSRGNPELEAVLSHRDSYCSMAELLRWEILRKRHPIVITGTHGKTTTTSIVAHAMQEAGENPGFLVGGIPKNFEINARTGTGKWFVIEGDEYDTAFFDKRSKFLHYVPQIVVMLNLEFDHADIFANIEEIDLAFRRLVLTIPENGTLIVNAEDERLDKIAATARCHVLRFGVTDGDIWTEHAECTPTGWRVTAVLPNDDRIDFELPLSGRHNLMNALAALGVAYASNAKRDRFVAGLGTFKGVARRADVLCDGTVTLIDDFGHHPTAVATTIDGLRKTYPNRRILAAFDPRSNTSVRKFFQLEWAEALSRADISWIHQLHRLEKIPEADRLDRNQLVSDIMASGATAFACDQVDEIIAGILAEVRDRDVIVMFSNGAFGGLKERIAKDLTERFQK